MRKAGKVCPHCSTGHHFYPHQWLIGELRIPAPSCFQKGLVACLMSLWKLGCDFAAPPLFSSESNHKGDGKKGVHLTHVLDRVLACWFQLLLILDFYTQQARLALENSSRMDFFVFDDPCEKRKAEKNTCWGSWFLSFFPMVVLLDLLQLKREVGFVSCGNVC